MPTIIQAFMNISGGHMLLQLFFGNLSLCRTTMIVVTLKISIFSIFMKKGITFNNTELVNTSFQLEKLTHLGTENLTIQKWIANVCSICADGFIT